MEKCQTCVHYKNFLFTRPICTRISNVELKTQVNKPLKVYEAFRICKGYFYEHEEKCSNVNKDDTVAQKCDTDT